MKNKFGIPEEKLNKIRERDKRCVYCGKVMIYPCVGNKQRDWATIEHLREVEPFYWSNGLKLEDIVICCGSCNSSRGKKGLLAWFDTPYCRRKNINEISVAEPVKKYLRKIKVDG